MTDSANVVSLMHPPFLKEMPAAAEKYLKESACARGSSMEQRLPSAGDAGKDLHKFALKSFAIGRSIGQVEWTWLVHGSKRHEAARLRGTPHHLWKTPIMITYAGGWLTVRNIDEIQSAEIATSALDPTEGVLQPELPLSTWGTEALGPDEYGDLQEVLSDLDGLREVAKEEDEPEPDTEAVANARILLPKLFELLPVRYRVSPTERRGVAIDAPMRWGASVAVECAPDDTVYCFVTIDGNSRRAKYYQMDGLPDVFIEKALRDLAAG